MDKYPLVIQLGMIQMVIGCLQSYRTKSVQVEICINNIAQITVLGPQFSRWPRHPEQLRCCDVARGFLPEVAGGQPPLAPRPAAAMCINRKNLVEWTPPSILGPRCIVLLTTIDYFDRRSWTMEPPMHI